MIYHQQHAQWMGHGYLAVDFFFLLSGFVIAKAYESKLASTMSFKRFVLVRVARLYPMLIAATLTSAAYMLLTSIRSGSSLGWLGLLPAALLALPDPSASLRPDPFPLLPVVWSLFFELFANFAYALCSSWLTTRRLAGLVGVNAVLLFAALVAHGNGELGNTYATLLAGFPRVFFSFLGGVLLFRLHDSGRLAAPSISPGLLAIVLLAALAAPHSMPRAFDAACIFILFPLILIGAMSNEPAQRWTAVARFSADVSYPLYLFHLPLMLWLSLALTYVGLATPALHAVEWFAVPILAYAAFVLFDRPIQAVLKKALAKGNAKAERVAEARAL